MSDIKKVTCFKVSALNAPEVDLYRFDLMVNDGFSYGNGTCVVIYRGGEFFCYVDTRYDKSVIKDFRVWCVEWLVNRHSQSVQVEEDAEYLEVYGNV